MENSFFTRIFQTQKAFKSNDLKGARKFSRDNRIRTPHLKKQGAINYSFIQLENKQEKINFSDILFVESIHKFANIHTLAKTYMLTHSMKVLEELLPSGDFILAYKSGGIAFGAHQFLPYLAITLKLVRRKYTSA